MHDALRALIAMLADQILAEFDDARAPEEDQQPQPADTEPA